MRTRQKILLPLIVIAILMVTVLPASGFSTSKPPVIYSLTINGQNAPTVYADVGEVSYSILLESFSANKKALVSLEYRNTESNQLTTVFEEQWLEEKTNSGTFALQKGTYEVTLHAKDEEGNVAQPYTVTVIVGSDTNLKLLEVSPNPILIKRDKETRDVSVTVENQSPSPKTTQVAWKWEGDQQWQEVKEVTLPGRYENLGRQAISFSITFDLQGKKERAIEFEVNPNHNPLEKDYGDNHANTYVQFDFPDLEIGEGILTAKTATGITVEFPVKQKDLPGRTQTLVTSMEYGLGAETTKLGEISNISLGVGEEKFISATFPLQNTVYARLNPHENAPPVELYGFHNNLEVTTLDLTKNMNLYVKSVKGGVYRQGDNVTTIVQVGNIPDSVMPEAVDLVLRFDGKEVGRQSVHLNPGEEREIPFEWKTPVTGKLERMTYKLEAEIHPQPRKFDEITYADNIKSGSVVLLPEEVVGAACRGAKVQTTAVSGTYEYYCNCTPTGCSICTGKYYESIFVTPEYQPATVKAGMGFAYKLKTEYHNSNPHNGSKHDFSKIIAEFDTEKDQGGTIILPSVELVPKHAPPVSENIWQFPRAKIERGQKDIEAIEYIHTLDPLEVDESRYVDGQNKYYTSFYQKDGMYPFVVKGDGAGVTYITHTDIDGNTTVTPVSPRLATCIDQVYNIQGSPHDDYNYRRVDPNNPYPHNIRPGWDWLGHEGYFDELVPWYNSNGKENSNGIGVEEFSVYPQEARR
ncbi:hypothetical protein [Brevibacillus thermoruber]|uniref:hypothetical protein n=1 Tax=Brevibacillus thermoruber TaxID=33942 RepID=UPI000557C3C2|nr:hypothetical protein [Brevibacillus thermoruber]